MNKPRYLNTIESEGNLPSQVVNTRQNTRNNKNELSKRSIHSLESLHSQEEAQGGAGPNSVQKMKAVDGSTIKT